MSISIVCPNGHKLSAKEEHAGKKLRCPKCRADVQVPAKPHESDDEEYDLSDVIEDSPPEPEEKDEPGISAKKRKRRKRRRATTPGIEGVEAKLDLGLRLHKYRLVCQLLILLVVLLALILQQNTPEATPWVLLILLGVSVICGLVGSVFLLWAPSQSGSRLFVIASLVLEVAAPVLVMVVNSLLTSVLGRQRPTVGGVLLWSGQTYLMFALLLSPWIVSMLALRKLSEHLDRTDLMDEALVLPIVMLAWGAVFIGVIAAALILVVLEFASPEFVLIVLYVTAIGCFVVSVTRLIKNVEFLDKLRKFVLPVTP